jgi:enamine deaminase RidA (YjgF/YER057c/UK114 family)
MNERRFLVPKGTEMMRDQYHFSQGVQVGDTIYVSGQGGWDATFNITPDAGAQARQAFRNMATVLKEAGASLDDVVEVTSYHLDMDQMGVVVEAMKEAFPHHQPAWTAVGVTRLALPQMLIEIKATAVVRKT